MGSIERPVPKEVIPETHRDVSRWAAGGRICPHYGSKEEGVGGPPSPAMLGRERQGRLIGTCKQWVRAVAEDDRVKLHLLTFPGGEDPAGSVTSGEQRERECGHRCRV